MAPRRLPALVVSAQAAALALLLVVAAALGGVHASGGRAEPRRLAAGGSGTAAELVKDSPRSSAEGEVGNSALVVNDSAPSSAKGGEGAEAEAEAEVEAGVPPLQLIIAEEGRAVGAVCLDGSAPGFYYRKGYGSGRNNWVLFFEGGAWCSSHHACAHRATTILGSSALFLPAEEMETTERGMKGMFSANRTINPDFYNWNAAFFPYCDGGSFSGDREHIPVPNGAPLYLRGRRVADLLLKHLIDRMGLAQAHQVVVAGCSAGAVAVLLHCDRIRAALEAIAPSISVRCIADSSMFLDLGSRKGKEKVVEGRGRGGRGRGRGGGGGEGRGGGGGRGGRGGGEGRGRGGARGRGGGGAGGDGQRGQRGQGSNPWDCSDGNSGEDGGGRGGGVGRSGGVAARSR
ncbi:hypothetical protein CLOP_g12862, partial [Closterium sp. NIES-67]